MKSIFILELILYNTKIVYKILPSYCTCSLMFSNYIIVWNIDVYNILNLCSISLITNELK